MRGPPGTSDASADVGRAVRHCPVCCRCDARGVWSNATSVCLSGPRAPPAGSAASVLGSRCLSSLIRLRLLVHPSVPSCAPVVVKHEPISSSCGDSLGDSLVRRARPAPGGAQPNVSSWISTPATGAACGSGIVCVVTLRQQPQATGNQAWDECSSRGDDRRSDAGPRRPRCSRCRGQACGRRARRPTDGGGTAPQVPAQVRVGDDTRFTASGPIRLTVHSPPARSRHRNR